MEKKKINIVAKDIDEGVKLVTIEGELDTVTSTEADEIISCFIDENKDIIMDCVNLKYLNSTGLALLLKYHIQMKRRERSLRIIILNKFISELLEAAGATKLLEIYKTQGEAIESLNSERAKRRMPQ